ncbi:MAG: hypothetical protein O3A10_10215 [Chloroflexi bacterium]|nr:hypothetical protein [Chloroflexota bacterium]MDA1146497.1 hypothetical protein [Chloroflexota bacterium]
MNAHSPRLPHLFATLLVVSAVVALACSGGDDPTPVATPTSDGGGGGADAGAGAAAGPGTFIFEGERIDAPYDVASSGRAVSVNGETILTLGGVTPDAPDMNAPIESAFGLANHAPAALYAAAASASALQAAADAIAGEPLLASVVVDAEAGELAITDTAGLEVFFIPTPPDGALRARSDGELEADAAALASEWSTLLDAGGLILVPSDGPTLYVAGSAAIELVAQIDEAIGLGGSEREARLVELLTHESVVAELIDRYEPAAQTRRAPSTGAGAGAVRAGADAPAGTARDTSISYEGARNDARPLAAQGAGGMSQTPGKPEAYIFTTLPDDGDAAPFFDVVKKEGYQVWVYQATHRAFEGRGWDNFQQTSGTGALYLATHGSPRGVSVESFANEAAAGRVQQRLAATEAGNFYWWTEADGTWWLAITIQGL